MSAFSSGLHLTDLNDFISPGLECIKPVKAPKKENKVGALTIELDDNGVYYESGQDGEKKQLETATITLEDCLACSGCITSAETVLISTQSVDQFRLVVEEARKTIVVSIAPQARAAIATHFDLSTAETAGKLKRFFENEGATHVFDTSFGRDLSLLEMREEFVHRFRTDGVTPMLTSACPGWVCYAEKTHGDFVLPHISTTKSPQQIMGTLVKEVLCKSDNLIPSKVYHVSVMPCYDKKLEATRQDFYDEALDSHDIDCVLTSGEVLSMLKESSTPFVDLDPSPPSVRFSNVDEDGTVYGVNSGSGGYLEAVFIYAAKELFDISLGPDDLVYTPGRNADVKELILEVNGEVLLRFAMSYGFRNIQNLVRKMKLPKGRKKKKAPTYHFVEVMACPSGCNNGGGQIKAASGEDPKELLERVEATYRDVVVRDAASNPAVQVLYSNWLGSAYSDAARDMLHTQYRGIETTDNPLAIKW